MAGSISSQERNWYEQAPHATNPGGLRWIKHHFRDLPFTDGYIEDLSDLAIDVNGDGYPDIVSCSYWDEPLTWWENPGTSNKPWRKRIIQAGSPVEFVFLVDLLNTGQARNSCRSSATKTFPCPGTNLREKDICEMGSPHRKPA